MVRPRVQVYQKLTSKQSMFRFRVGHICRSALQSRNRLFLHRIYIPQHLHRWNSGRCVSRKESTYSKATKHGSMQCHLAGEE